MVPDTIVGSVTQVDSAYGRLDVVVTAPGGSVAIAPTKVISRDTNGDHGVAHRGGGAVNYLGLQNAATSSPPQVKLRGGDTNISLVLMGEPGRWDPDAAGTGVHPRLTATGAGTNSDLLNRI